MLHVVGSGPSTRTMTLVLLGAYLLRSSHLALLERRRYFAIGILIPVLGRYSCTQRLSPGVHGACRCARSAVVQESPLQRRDKPACSLNSVAGWRRPAEKDEPAGAAFLGSRLSSTRIELMHNTSGNDSGERVATVKECYNAGQPNKDRKYYKSTAPSICDRDTSNAVASEDTS